MPFAERASRVLDVFHAFKARPLLAWPLIIGNLVAVYYGWTDYYAAQFDATPLVLWPFVSDSPNAVLLFAASLFLYQVRRPSRIVDLFAFIANVKVGLWTVFVLTYYYDDFFSHDATLRWLLLWLHVGMVGQAFVLYRDLVRVPWKPVTMAVVSGIFFVHDFLDYGVGTHPYLPATPSVLVILVSVGLTLVSLALADQLFVRHALVGNHGADALGRPTETASLEP